jgi:hypothetical protein
MKIAHNAADAGIDPALLQRRRKPTKAESARAEAIWPQRPWER